MSSRIPVPLFVALGLGTVEGCLGPCLSPPPVQPAPEPPAHPCLSAPPEPVEPDESPVHPCLSVAPPTRPRPPEPPKPEEPAERGARRDDVLRRLPPDVAERVRST